MGSVLGFGLVGGAGAAGAGELAVPVAGGTSLVGSVLGFGLDGSAGAAEAAVLGFGLVGSAGGTEAGTLAVLLVEGEGFVVPEFGFGLVVGAGGAEVGALAAGAAGDNGFAGNVATSGRIVVPWAGRAAGRSNSPRLLLASRNCRTLACSSERGILWFSNRRLSPRSWVTGVTT